MEEHSKEMKALMQQMEALAKVMMDLVAGVRTTSPATNTASEKGMEVYESNNIKIQTQTQPVLQGCREMSGLWTVDAKYKQK
jgi:hypothetical protein